jgi:spermidine synthase
VIPWEHLDSASIPGDDGELRLMRRGSEFSIMLGGNELMNSRLSGSEEALARLSLEQIPDWPRPSVLVGGLGMGFTLRALLAAMGAEARITVAELVPAVVEWARGPMAEIFAGSLDDPRVTIAVGDVAELIAGSTAAYDAIILDVDNGPEGLTSSANDRLYAVAGLGAARAALRPGGVLSVWSSGPDSSFTSRLRQAGFVVEEARVRASRKGRGARHVIWLALRPFS